MFAEYIRKCGESRAAWATRIGVSRSYLSDMLNGKKTPSLDVAVRIERLTQGAVPASSWIAPAPDAGAPAVAPPETDAA